MNNFFLYLQTKEFRKNLLIAIGSVLGFVLIVIFILNLYTRHGQSMPVPTLRGLNVNNAIELLEARGLGYEIDSVYQIDRPPGTVIEQDPDPNTSVKSNRTIYLTIITSQAPNIAFPDIVDRTFVEAVATLRYAGLKLGDTLYTSDIARDRVLEARFGDQPVRKGEDIPKGSRINLILGDGNGTVEVDIPDLTGLSLSNAIFTLKGASLSLGSVTYEGIGRDTANAYIIRQMPAPSDSLTKVNIGSRINVVLSAQKR
jgi:beta-lactam-binding protein with PASTA domain